MMSGPRSHQAVNSNNNNNNNNATNHSANLDINNHIHKQQQVAAKRSLSNSINHQKITSSISNLEASPGGRQVEESGCNQSHQKGNFGQQQPKIITNNNHRSTNSVQYVSSDGSVFTLAHHQFPLRHKPRLTIHEKQQQQHRNHFQSAAENLHKINHVPHQVQVNGLSPACSSRAKLLDHRQEQINNLNSSPSSSSSSSSAGGRSNNEQEHQTTTSRRKQQHRQLQYQVHQKLNQIYGDNPNRKAAESKQQALFKQHKQQIQQQLDTQIQKLQHQQTFSTNNSSSINNDMVHSSPYQQQQHQTRAKNQHLMMVSGNNNNNINNNIYGNHQPQEQTYDSLSPTSTSKQQMNDSGNLYNIEPHPIHHHHHLHQHNQNEHNALMGPANPHHQRIAAIQEECGSGVGVLDSNLGENEEEEDLLLPTEMGVIDEGGRVTKRAVALERKNQLEDLHYATATAAALLSATANAAAAFAATAEKQFGPSNNSSGSSDRTNSQSQLINSIYSDETYQEVRKQHQHHHQQLQQQQQLQQRCIISEFPNHHHHHASGLTKFKAQQQQQQQLLRHKKQRNAIYTEALDQQASANYLVPNERRLQVNNALAAATAAAASSSNAIYSPVTKHSNNLAGANSQIYGILQVPPANPYQHYQASLVGSFNHQLPLPPNQHHHHHGARPVPQPPMRRLNNANPAVPQQPFRSPPNALISNELIRQQQQLHHHHRLIQQQRQLTQLQSHQQHNQNAPPIHGMANQTQIPALAILHHGKGASAKADLIGRMLVNNMLVAQQAVPNNNNNNNSENPYASALALAVAESHRQAAGNKLSLADHQNNQVLACLARGSDKLYRNNPGGAIFSVSGAMPPPPSDSSGHSNVPLVLDRDLRSLSFIERVCRIDLTLFWWSLIVISFIFMGTVVTISRYIF